MKKILICDYPNVLSPDYTITIDALKSVLKEKLKNYCIEIYAYKNNEDFITKLQNVEGIITGFLKIDESILSKAPSLKCISVSGTGYGNIDCVAAQKYGVTVCHIKEYCTQEVAEHTFSLICALNRNLKYYSNQIEQSHQWMYHSIDGRRNLNEQTLGIYGFGNIGKRVAKIAKCMGMHVITLNSSHTNLKEANLLDVNVVSENELLEQADIISNHMNLTPENYHYFNFDRFKAMKKHPLFINVGRGGCVDENDLIHSLNEGLLSGAGLDVLEAEKPDLLNHKLLHRDNVIITPHSAFYSQSSIDALQNISAFNLAYFLINNYSKIFSIVK